jgi:hypothetical protein
MAIKVESGWLAGNFIRQARVAATCQYFRGKSNGGMCRKPINPGEFYCEGEYTGSTGRNGTLLYDKYCLECAGPEAVAALATAKAS